MILTSCLKVNILPNEGQDGFIGFIGAGGQVSFSASSPVRQIDSNLARSRQNRRFWRMAGWPGGIILVLTGIDWIVLNLVDPSQPILDLMFRFDELLKMIWRQWRRITALWFESDYYWLWYKMTLKVKHALELIVVNIHALLKIVGTVVDSQKAVYENKGSPVGAVVATASSPMSSSSLTDTTWQEYWEKLLAEHSERSEKLATQLAQLASNPVSCGPGQSCAQQKEFIAFVAGKVSGDPDSPWRAVWEKVNGSHSEGKASRAEFSPKG
jgi:hypothetical protein